MRRTYGVGANLGYHPVARAALYGAAAAGAGYYGAGYGAYGYGYPSYGYGYGTGYSYPSYGYGYGYGRGILRRGLYAAAWHRWR